MGLFDSLVGPSRFTAFKQGLRDSTLERGDMWQDVCPYSSNRLREAYGKGWADACDEDVRISGLWYDYSIGYEDGWFGRSGQMRDISHNYTYYTEGFRDGEIDKREFDRKEEREEHEKAMGRRK